MPVSNLRCRLLRARDSVRREAASLCAGHAQQLGGESPLADLMEVRPSDDARATAARRGLKEAWNKGASRMNKNRIQGASAGRAGNLPRSPYPSRTRSVDSAIVHGRRLSLPQEICSASPPATEVVERPPDRRAEVIIRHSRS